MLEQSCELLPPELCARLSESMSGEALGKPPDHQGGSATDMFVLALSPAEVETILAVIRSAEAKGATTTGTRERGLGGFAAAWGEYRDSLGEGG